MTDLLNVILLSVSMSIALGLMFTLAFFWRVVGGPFYGRTMPWIVFAFSLVLWALSPKGWVVVLALFPPFTFAALGLLVGAGVAFAAGNAIGARFGAQEKTSSPEDAAPDAPQEEVVMPAEVVPA